jgi:hypothetical protein
VSIGRRSAASAKWGMGVVSRGSARKASLHPWLPSDAASAAKRSSAWPRRRDPRRGRGEEFLGAPRRRVPRRGRGEEFLGVAAAKSSSAWPRRRVPRRSGAKIIGACLDTPQSEVTLSALHPSCHSQSPSFARFRSLAMTRYEPRLVSRCLEKGSSRIMTGLVMREVDRGGEANRTCGRNKNEHDRCDQWMVTRNTGKHGVRGSLTRKKIVRAKRAKTARNARGSGHVWS